MNPTKVKIGGSVEMDLGVLIKTRLLITANSGGGKSWLIRRLAEQLFGLVPVLIIDPEGEFATLREKFGYVLVGKGGETPADPRSAELVAHKLLELQASAVCDLYEMSPRERHHWVRLFLEALVDAPKSLWRPLIVMVDEAHTFCPEKGQGESEAAEAMTALSTRGRKRRFCAVWATQRLAKLNKSASAEFLNRLVGPTFEDVDLKRAGDLLSIAKEDRRAFEKDMRVLEPGTFHALGRAISKERVIVKVGPVQTSHEVEDSKQGLGPPPTPDKIKSLLPKLADLPKEAEEKLHTEAELRMEIRSLKKQLAVAPAPKLERKEVPILTADDRRNISRINSTLEKFCDQQQKVMGVIHDTRTLAATLSARINGNVFQPAKHPVPVPATRPAAPHPATIPKATSSPASADSNSPLSKAERAILRVLANYPEGKARRDVGVIAGYVHSGGSFGNAVGSLRTKGLIEGSDPLRITEAGQEAFGPVEPLPSGKELFDYWMNRPDLGKAAREVLRVLYEARRPMPAEEIAPLTRSDKGTPYEPSGGSFGNGVGRLRTYELIEGRGLLQAAKEFFE